MLLRGPLFRHPTLLLSQWSPHNFQHTQHKLQSISHRHLRIAAFTTSASGFDQAAVMSMNTAGLDEKLWEGVKKIVPSLKANNYKGQAGKIGIIGGCREYTGAPYFASISALKVGADLSHVFCTEGAATVIKSYSPELIVHPYLPSSEVQGGGDPAAVKRSVEAIQKWLERFDVVVVGPGLGRDECVQQTVRQVIATLREMKKPVVFDADGLHIIKSDPGMVKGWTNAVLTPNHGEFVRLAAAVGVEVDESDPTKNLEEVTRRYDGPLIVQKGLYESISDGQCTIACRVEGSPRRAGGQGDVLSGTLAAFMAWATTNSAAADEAAEQVGVPALLIAAYGAACTVRLASQAAFKRKRRSMLAGDVIEELGQTIDNLFDCGEV